MVLEGLEEATMACITKWNQVRKGKEIMHTPNDVQRSGNGLHSLLLWLKED